MRGISSLHVRIAVMAPVLAILITSCALMVAQTTTATLSGTVTDPQHAAVPGATVSAVCNETTIKKTVNTDNQGRYTLLHLAPGTYTVTVEAAGFALTRMSEVRLEVAQSGALDVQLAVAASQQKIEVNAEAGPLLHTETGGLEHTLESKLIQDLPSAERSTLALINNMPGVIDPGFALATGESLNTDGTVQGPIGSPGNRNFFDSVFSVSGSPASSNDVLLDGVSDTSGDFGGIAISPPQDSVMELKVLSGTFSAEYGRSGGAVVSFATKAGGAKYHGTLYEYFQNGGLNANGWQRNRAGYRTDGVTLRLPRIPIKRNQFGGSIGGPVILPHHGREKRTFFFFNYEGRNERNPYSKVLTLPTARMRTGDLSELLQASTRTGVPLNADGSAPRHGQIYDPFGALVANPSGTMVRRTIEGNRLDLLPKCGSGPRLSACLDPVGLKLLSYLPLPNQPGLTDNYLYSGTSRFTRDLTAARIDQTLSDKHSFFGRFSHERRLQEPPNFLGSVASSAQTVRDTFFNFTFNDVYTLTPGAINNVRYGYTRSRANRIPTGQNFDPTELGLPSYIRDFANGLSFPIFNFSGGPESQGIAGEITSSQIGVGYSNSPRDTQTAADTFTWVRSGHTVKTGVEYRLLRYFSVENANPTGTFTFTRAFTRGPVPTATPAVATDTGSSLASLLLGMPASGTYRTQIPLTLYHHYGAAFVQDDWRVRRNLTLNLGVRWEVETATADAQGQINSFDFQAKSPLNGQVAMPADAMVQALRPNFTDLRGLLSFPDGPQTATRFNRFAPRFGFAYRWGEKTVIRGGYGVNFVPQSMEVNSANGVTFDSSVPQASDASGQVIQAGGTASPTVFLTNPFPSGLTAAPGRSLGSLTLIGESPTLVETTRANPYVQQYNFVIQRMLPGKLMLETAYVGGHGVRLPLPILYINQLPPEYLDYGRANYASARDANGVAAANAAQFFSQQVTNPFYGIITKPGLTLSSRTVPRWYLLKSYPQYNDPGLYRPLVGASKYNALQVTVRRMYSNGLTLLSTYTFSKTMDISYIGRAIGSMGSVRVEDAFNPARDYTISDIDVPHRFTSSFSYELPRHPGRRYGKRLGSFVDGLLGGFQFSGSMMWQTGTPVTLLGPSIGLGYQAAGMRPDRVAGVSGRISGDQMRKNIRNGGYAFNPAAFAQPLDYTLGNSARNCSDVRRDTYKNVNLSVLKNFVFREGRQKIQLRGEFLNAFNMVVFGTPGRNITNRDVVQNGVVVTQGTFARVTTQGNQPRIIQLVLRYSF